MDLVEKANSLLEKCEAMSLLCTKANYFWSIMNMVFKLPLILTSSVMCILNSFDDDKGGMKIPNVVVNGVSVLILSLQSNLKVPEKVELFKSLSDQFLLLSHQIDKYEENEITKDIVNNLTDKYDALVQQVNFSEIPRKYKLEVITLWDKEQKSLPLSLNGVSGIRINKKRFSNNKSEADIGHAGEIC